MRKKLTDRLHRLVAYLSHSLKTREIDVKGIQSPFVYGFVHNITKNLWPYYTFQTIESSRIELIGDLAEIKKGIKGKGLLLNCLPGIEIGSEEEIIAGQTIFRIIDYVQANNILEIGTFFGIDTLYMCYANPSATCISISGNPEMAEMALDILEKQDMSGIKVVAGNHSEGLKKTFAILNSIDFVLFNATGDFEQRLEDFRRCLSVSHSGTVFAMKYIHSSPEMEKIWKIARNHEEVSASIDLFYIGILLFRQDIEKKNYIIRQNKNLQYEDLH